MIFTGTKLSFIREFQFLRPSPNFCAETYDQGGLQEVQLEDGSTAYIQHTVHMPQSNTILAIQADGTIADLQAEAAAIDPETISVLEQYTTKVRVLCLCTGVVPALHFVCVCVLTQNYNSEKVVGYAV